MTDHEHDPESDAARYLGGEMHGAVREQYDRHLLSCRRCREEVRMARAGRTAVEGLREVAPATLRDQTRALIDAEADADTGAGRGRGRPVPAGRRRLPRRAAMAAAACLTAAAAAAAGIVIVTPGSTDPADGHAGPALQQAVADYAAHRLPDAQAAAGTGPDLSGMQLQLIGAGAGDYAGLAVDGYAYRDPTGRRVVLYLSKTPFPEPDHAHPLGKEGGPWMAQEGAVAVLCSMPASGRPAASLLVVGPDEELVTHAAEALGAL